MSMNKRRMYKYVYVVHGPRPGRGLSGGAVSARSASRRFHIPTLVEDVMQAFEEYRVEIYM